LRAQHTAVSESDPTGKAELNLVKHAAKVLSKSDLARATMVSSTEPCPMCAGAIYWSGIKALVYGCSAMALGEISGEYLAISAEQVLSSGKQHKVEVFGPVLEDECKALHRAFWPGWSKSGADAKRQKVQGAASHAAAAAGVAAAAHATGNQTCYLQASADELAANGLMPVVLFPDDPPVTYAEESPPTYTCLVAQPRMHMRPQQYAPMQAPMQAQAYAPYCQ